MIATGGLAGVVAVLGATDAGQAPGNGEQTFDAPGCGPERYDGPGRIQRRSAQRPCPIPKPVVVARSRRVRGGWRVTLDGSRSFDPNGERLVSYIWAIDPHAVRRGARVALLYRRPGSRRIVLYVTDESGARGAATYTLRLR